MQQLLQRRNLSCDDTSSSATVSKLLVGNLLGTIQGFVQGLYEGEVLPVTRNSSQNSLQGLCCFGVCISLRCLNATDLVLPTLSVT